MISADSADEGRSARNGEVCGQRNNRRGHHEQPPLATNRCKHRRTVHRSSATHFSVACREPAPAVRPTGKRLRNSSTLPLSSSRSAAVCRRSCSRTPFTADGTVPSSAVRCGRLAGNPIASRAGRIILLCRPLRPSGAGDRGWYRHTSMAATEQGRCVHASRAARRPARQWPRPTAAAPPPTRRGTRHPGDRVR